MCNDIGCAKEHLRKYLDRDDNDIGGAFLIQEKIDFVKEYRVLVLNGKSIACVAKKCKQIPCNADVGVDFKVDEDENIENLAIEVIKAHKLFFSGVNIVKTRDNQLYILECNRNPHFKAVKEAYLKKFKNKDFDIAQMVINEIELVFQKREEEKNRLSLNSHPINGLSLNSEEYHIFISYLREDKLQADTLRNILKDYGIRVYLDEEEAGLSENGINKSLNNLNNSKRIVIIFSRVTLSVDTNRIYFKELDEIKNIEEQNCRQIAIPIILQNTDLDLLKNKYSAIEYIFNTREPKKIQNDRDYDEVIKRLIREILE